MLPWLILALAVARADALGPGDHTRTLTVGGRERTYLVHVPKSYDGSKPFPVVLAFHGGGSLASSTDGMCQLPCLAFWACDDL